MRSIRCFPPRVSLGTHPTSFLAHAAGATGSEGRILGAGTASAIEPGLQKFDGPWPSRSEIRVQMDGETARRREAVPEDRRANVIPPHDPTGA
jgi:hypothetical protein